MEWLAHNIVLGFSDFLLFSNDCDDGSDLLLDAMDRAGLITHIRNDVDPDRGPQWSALRSKPLRKALKSADWAAHLDVDEFLVVHPGDHRLPALLDPLAEVDAISVPWRFFGNSGVDTFVDQPVAAQFTTSSPEGILFPRQTLMYKTLFRPGQFKKPGIHAPKPRDDIALDWRNGNGAAMSSHFDPQRSVMTPADAGVTLAQINHYALRSRESFLVKSARGLPNRSDVAIDLTYWVLRNFNSRTDLSGLYLADQTAAARAELMAIPDIAKAHAACCIAHRDRANALLQTADGAQLYAAITVAGSSVAPSQQETMRIYGAYQAIFGKTRK